MRERETDSNYLFNLNTTQLILEVEGKRKSTQKHKRTWSVFDQFSYFKPNLVILKLI